MTTNSEKDLLDIILSSVDEKWKGVNYMDRGIVIWLWTLPLKLIETFYSRSPSVQCPGTGSMQNLLLPRKHKEGEISCWPQPLAAQTSTRGLINWKVKYVNLMSGITGVIPVWSQSRTPQPMKKRPLLWFGFASWKGKYLCLSTFHKKLNLLPMHLNILPEYFTWIHFNILIHVLCKIQIAGGEEYFTISWLLTPWQHTDLLCCNRMDSILLLLQPPELR